MSCHFNQIQSANDYCRVFNNLYIFPKKMRLLYQTCNSKQTGSNCDQYNCHTCDYKKKCSKKCYYQCQPFCKYILDVECKSTN